MAHSDVSQFYLVFDVFTLSEDLTASNQLGLGEKQVFYLRPLSEGY